MARDFDAPRAVDTLDDPDGDATIATFRARVRQDVRPAPDEAALADALADTFLLAGADLSDAALAVAVIPQQAHEFRCTSCFLVLHRSLRDASADVCRDCA